MLLSIFRLTRDPGFFEFWTRGLMVPWKLVLNMSRTFQWMNLNSWNFAERYNIKKFLTRVSGFPHGLQNCFSKIWLKLRNGWTYIHDILQGVKASKNIWQVFQVFPKFGPGVWWGLENCFLLDMARTLERMNLATRNFLGGRALKNIRYVSQDFPKFDQGAYGALKTVFLKYG